MSSDYPTIIRATRPWSASSAASEYERDKKRRRGDPAAPEREGRRAYHKGGDSPEQVQLCLNCKLTDCRNCVEVSPSMQKLLMRDAETAGTIRPQKIEKRGRKPGTKTIKGEIRALMEQGYDEQKIAWKLNADRTGVWNIMLKIMEESEI